MKFNLEVSNELRQACPNYRGAAVYATVRNTLHSEGLWQEIDAFTRELQATETVDSIKQQTAIVATRDAYRACGKDPSRYRPSAEALRRRLLRGLDLYQIDTLVDLINLVSLRTGYSIGGFDADKIQGTNLCLGIGKADEEFEGIGRGIGTPTSDHERTKMGIETTHILALINGYSGEKGLQEAAEMTLDLLKKYADATEGEIVLY